MSIVKPCTMPRKDGKERRCLYGPAYNLKHIVINKNINNEDLIILLLFRYNICSITDATEAIEDTR